MNRKVLILSCSLLCSTTFALHKDWHQAILFTGTGAILSSMALGGIGLILKPSHASEYLKLIGCGFSIGCLAFISVFCIDRQQDQE